MKIHLGKVLETDFEVYHDSELATNGHILVNGVTGTGKSVFLQKASLDIVKQGGTVIALSWHKSLTDDQIFPAFYNDFASYRNDVAVHKSGLGLDLFKRITYADGEVEDELCAGDAAAGILCNALQVDGRQRIAVKRACQRVAKRGTYEEIGIRAVEEALLSVDAKGAGDARERLYCLTDRGLLHSGSDIKKNAINIIQLSRLDSDAQAVLVEICLQYAWRLGNADCFKDSPIFILLDECHNAMHTERSGLSMLISEGRKMNIHLLLATQLILQGTPNTVQQRLAQAGLMIYFKPVYNRITLTAKMISASNPDEWAERLADLQRGQFIACGNFVVEGRKLNHPIVVDGVIDEDDEDWDEEIAEGCEGE